MRIDKENYELVLFELLEGLIPEEERSGLLKQIEQDPFLAKEWKLMQQTVLQPDPVLYEGKSTLYKKTTILPFINRWAVAASVILLLGLGWFTFRSNPGVGEVEPVYSVRTKTKPPQLPKEDYTPFEVEAGPDIQPIHPKESDTRVVKNETVEPQKVEREQLPALTNERSVELAWTQPTQPKVEPVTSLPTGLEPVTRQPSRNIDLPQAMNSVLVAAIQTTRFVRDLRKGKIQIQRNKVEDQPAIEVALVTDQYVKSAIIQYKTK